MVVRGLFFSLALFVVTPMAAQAQQSPRVIADVGLTGSESIRHDVADDRYLISNLGERGPANDGFIAVMSPDLSITTLKWIEGGRDGVELYDPLGLIIHGDVVVVADLGVVRRFNRTTGAPLEATPIPGSVRLNDLAVDAQGALYVTDSGNEATPGALYKIDPDGSVTAFVARDAGLNRPNGIAVTSDGLIVHGGLGGAVLTYRNADGQVVRERTLPTGRIDGIVALPDGELLAASQDGHVVYHVPAQPDALVRIVAEGIDIPAAIGADLGRKRLLVPQIRAASVTVVDLP